MYLAHLRLARTPSLADGWIAFNWMILSKGHQQPHLGLAQLMHEESVSIQVDLLQSSC